MDQQQKKMKTMLEAPVGPLVVGLALPAILSMLVTSLYNMADTYFVGQISTSATGAVGVSFGLMSIIQAVGFFFGHGSGNFISKRLGRGETEQAGKMAAIGFVFSLAAGLLIAVAGRLFDRPLAYLLGSTESILPHALEYMRIVLLGAPFMCASFNLNNQLRFQGNTVYGMVGIVCGAVLNIALDPLFIFGLNMGIAGAAWATLISQILSFFVLLAGCLGKKSLGLPLKKFSLEGSYLKEMLRGGLPSLLRQGFMALSVICLNQACRVAGDEASVDAAIAAMGVVSKIMGFSFSIVIGIGQGFQPVCGFNYGAGRYARVKRAFWLCVALSSGVLVLMSALGYFAAEPLVKFFRDDLAVVQIGAKALRWQCVGFVLAGFTTMSNMMLQNIGMVVRASYLAVARQGIYFIPLVMGLPLLWGLNGVLLAQPLADLLAFLSAAALHLPVLKSLERSGEGERGSALPQKQE